MFVFLRGTAQVSVSKNGSLVRVGVLRQGDCFGEMSFLTGEPRTATVRAEKDCEVLEISKTVMADLLRDSPECLTQLSALLAHRKMETEGKLKEANVPEEEARHGTRIHRFFHQAIAFVFRDCSDSLAGRRIRRLPAREKSINVPHFQSDFLMTFFAFSLLESGVPIALVCAVAGLLFAFFLIKSVMSRSPETRACRKSPDAIQEGAKAYLNRQVMTISAIAVVIFILLCIFKDIANWRRVSSSARSAR